MKKVKYVLVIAFILLIVNKINAQTTWSTTGNTGTSAVTNFLGTKDNIDLIFRRNNIKCGSTGLRNTIFGSRQLIGTNEQYSTPVEPTNNTRNSYFGSMAGLNNTDGNYNTLIGYISGMNIKSSGNTFVGCHTGQDASTGDNNLLLGNYSGAGLTTGSYNVFIGKVTSPVANTNKNIIIADGEGNQRINILDNGNMGVGTASPTERLEVNGNAKAIAFISISDKKFKKNIKSLENSLETIEALNGKSYQWNIEEFKEKKFDSRNHSGFIAQDLEKVLPHLVYTTENQEKAVNYIELIPYLVEAIKEQQLQINELKSQLSENFKSKNQDLIELENTKIINVSPNPSNNIISISLSIDKNIKSASLQVNDLNGKLLSNLNIKERDTNITKSLQKDNFGQGTYIVTLIINGKSIDTKKIIFN